MFPNLFSGSRKYLTFCLSRVIVSLDEVRDNSPYIGPDCESIHCASCALRASFHPVGAVQFSFVVCLNSSGVVSAFIFDIAV